MSDQEVKNLELLFQARIDNDEKIEPKMKKKDLVKTIKKKVKNNDSMILRNPKKLTMFSDEAPMNLPIGQMFSIGKK